MVDSKEILKYCPNYYNIVNFNYEDNDLISEKIISIYKSYIFSIDINNNEDVNNIQKLDKVLASYIRDYIFRDELKKEIVTVKIMRDNNLLRNLANAIIKIFNNYEEYTTRKIYISRWI